MPFTVLDHTADTGLEATAPDLAALIGELASGMFGLMGEVAVPASGTVDVVVAASSPEDMVVDSLGELLYVAETRDCWLGGFEVGSRTPGSLRIRAASWPASAVTATGPPIKAVTYHDLVVEERSGAWLGRVYFDV